MEHCSRMHNDRLIHIHVGEATEERPHTASTFLIQESILVSKSTYFARVLSNDRFQETQTGIFRFPDDDVDAWKIMACYILKGELPDSVGLQWLFNGPSWAEEDLGEDMLWVRCWALGDYFGIPAFQDEVMFKLISYIGLWQSDFDVIREAFMRTPEGSPLRRLMAEEAVNLQLRQRSLKAKELGALYHIPGFYSAFDKARVRYRDHRQPQRFEYRTWRKYIVGDVPEKHWFYGNAPSEEEMCAYEDDDDD